MASCYLTRHGSGRRDHRQASDSDHRGCVLVCGRFVEASRSIDIEPASAPSSPKSLTIGAFGRTMSKGSQLRRRRPRVAGGLWTTCSPGEDT